ncbi:MAG: LytR/AlgR family response regulator transcription factor [Bacteroidia bacterium]
MENLRVLIVEDEFIIASNLKMMLEDLGYQPLNPVGTKKEAMEVLSNAGVDLAILDINLSGKQEGIEVAKFINEHVHIPFIFLTSNADKATINEAKLTFPKSYLIKPFTEEDIYSAIEVALASNVKQDQSELDKLNIFKDSLFVKLGNKYFRVDINDIVYFEADGKLMHIYTKSGQKFSIRTSLEALFAQLKSYNFIRIHRSYCINSHYLEVINGDFVLVNKQQVPIGRNFRDDLLVNIKTIS